MEKQTSILPFFGFNPAHSDINRLMKKSGKVNALTYENTTWNPFTINNLVRLNWFNIIHLILAILFLSWNFFAILYFLIQLNNTCINDVSNIIKKYAQWAAQCC